MKTLMPWTGMTTLRKEMDRLFDRAWEPEWPAPAWPTFGDWMPKMDVADTKDAFVVTAELPGIDPKEITLTVEGEALTIKGEKKLEKEEKKEGTYYRMERTYGAFARTLPLPAPVEPGKVTATFKNGVLMVTLPKGAAAKGTMIPIKPE